MIDGISQGSQAIKHVAAAIDMTSIGYIDGARDSLAKAQAELEAFGEILERRRLETIPAPPLEAF